MKKYIKASSAEIMSSEDGLFTLVARQGTGINDTPWTGMDVISHGLADKHVVEIRLNTKGMPKFEGQPVNYTYSGCYVSHGMRGTMDTLEDTEDYIYVLQCAVKFARRINRYLTSTSEI